MGHDRLIINCPLMNAMQAHLSLCSAQSRQANVEMLIVRSADQVLTRRVYSNWSHRGRVLLELSTNELCRQCVVEEVLHDADVMLAYRIR
jgi:hypothetical protein